VMVSFWRAGQPHLKHTSPPCAQSSVAR
jgi:hypothetical protein